MRAKLIPYALGLAGMASAWGLSLPNYHHAAGLARVDCAQCLVTIARNTRQLAEQAAEAKSNDS